MTALQNTGDQPAVLQSTWVFKQDPSQVINIQHTISPGEVEVFDFPEDHAFIQKALSLYPFLRLPKSGWARLLEEDL